MGKLKSVLALQACAILVSACGGGSGYSAETATSVDAGSASSLAPTLATNGTASTTTTAATTTNTTATTGTQTAATTSTATATASTVALHWVTPAANATVQGTTTVTLAGQAFKNVEIFSGGVRIATAAVSSDSTTATATIDTTKLANGTESLTAHAWNSSAGTAYTSDADAGALNLVVSNAVATAAVTSAPAATVSTTTSSGPLIGVNLHLGGTNTTDNQKIADVMNARHLGSARMEFNKDLDLALFRDQVTRLKAYGIKAEINLQNSYQWDSSANQNFAAVQADSYAQTVVLVDRIGDLATDFELLNEITLRPETRAQVAMGAGFSASAFVGKSSYATMTAVLKGMANAIHDRAAATGRPYRVILGAVGLDFGFLDFMQQQGVVFDVVGYHTYPSLVAPEVATDPFYGPGGPLAQLARFNKPVRINEFNCGEIYLSSYTNLAGSASTATCMASIQKHLSSLMTQNIVNLETVDAFVLLDDPKQTVPAETRFGLMYDLNTPKIHLAAFSLFAGGAVSTTEKATLTAAGVSGK